jgi:hypothetical protein
MGGYGVVTVNGITQACAMISEAAIMYSGLASRRRGPPTSSCPQAVVLSSQSREVSEYKV